MAIVPQKKVKGKKAPPSAPLLTLPLPKGALGEPSIVKQPLLGVGHWLMDKDILCWLNQEPCHVEIDQPHAWTLVVLEIKRLSSCMWMVESGTTLDNMAWSRRHIFVVNSDEKEVCAFDCRVRLERFIIWVREPLSSIHFIRPFLTAIEKLCSTTKHRALAFQKEGWSCGF